jgi:type I restriction enzyme S subunit
MFGDPITNEKGWEVKCLRDISTIGTGATPSREKEELYYGGEIHWVKTTEVQNCDIHSTEETITQLAVEQTNCKVYPQNTLLMAMYGQGKTRGQIARLKISAATNQACAAIMLDEARCILDFIYELLLIKYESIRAMAKGGNQANLNLKIVGSIPIILPPLALQQEFTDKIEAIEKQKELIKKSISETETLFNARMDYYFN